MEMNICSFILSTGFSSNEYRPLHLKCCLCSFTTFFFCCCLHWKRRLQEGGCWGRQTCASAAFSFSLLMVAAWQQCYPLHHFSTVSIPGLSINVHQPHVPRGGCNPTALLYHLLGLLQLLDWFCSSLLCPPCRRASPAHFYRPPSDDSVCGHSDISY